MAITLIQTVTVGSGGVASIDFTGIPGTYTDLMIVLSSRTTESGVLSVPYVEFNGSTTDYSYRRLYGIPGVATSSDSGSVNITGYTNGASATANTFGNIIVYVPNYTSSQYKSLSSEGVGENNTTTGGLAITTGLWANTAAITSVKLYGSSYFNWLQYSSASLYGVTKGSSGGVTVS